MPNASPSTTLREEQTLITSLTELMKHEQQLLIGADADGLTALTAQKSQLTARMATLAAQRHQALGAAGFAAGEGGMESWLGSCGEPGVMDLWQDLLNLTRAAKELNRVNGMLINKQMAHNQAILNAMRTPAGGADAGFYGPSGHATSGVTARRSVVG